MEAAEAKDRARKDAEQREKEEAQKKLDEERAAQLGKPDADVAAPDEPAGDHITTAQPANAGGHCPSPHLTAALAQASKCKWGLPG